MDKVEHLIDQEVENPGSVSESWAAAAGMGIAAAGLVGYGLSKKLSGGKKKRTAAQKSASAKNLAGARKKRW